MQWDEHFRKRSNINEWMQACFIDTFYFEEFMEFFFVCLAVAEVFF